MSDATGNGNDGTNNGATNTTGIIDSAFSYDGINDYIDTNNNTVDTVTTYSLWVNTTTALTRVLFGGDGANRLHCNYSTRRRRRGRDNIRVL